MSAATPARGRAWPTALSVALALHGFFLPFSTAGVSLTLGVLVVLAAIRWRELAAARPAHEPVMLVGLVLLAFIALHSLVFTGWSPVTGEAINRYQELVIAPLLLALLAGGRQRRSLYRGWVLGSCMLAAAFWLARLHPAFAPPLESHRISGGFAIATAAFLLLLRAPRRPSASHLLAALLAFTVLFGMDGRTGQLALLLYAACVGWRLAPPRWRWALALALPLVLGTLALASPGVQDRLHEMETAWTRQTPPSDASSTGIRIELMRITGHLAQAHPWIGVGFGRYPQAHEAAARELYATLPGGSALSHGIWMHSANPHSEFMMQLIGGGAVSLALFLAWLGAGLYTARQARGSAAGAALAGLVLAFALGCLFNSWLLDFVEGHVYVALLAFLVAEIRHPLREDSFDRVLVIATRQIGDVLLTTPLVRAARRRWPQARIGVLGFTGTLGMLRGNPDIDALIELPPGRRWQTLALAARLWRRWDLALVTDPGDRAHLAGVIAAPVRSGLLPAQGSTNRLKRALLAHAVVSAGDLGTVHVAEEKMALLAPWQPGPVTPGPLVPPPGAPLPADLQAALQPGAVIVHAPSMWSYKQWPLPHWQGLVRGLLAQGRQVVLTGSASARDQECVAPLRGLGEAPALLDASGRLDFNQLVTLMQGCALFIGPDTSISHLAAAVGIRQVAIFGPTNPQRWAPWTGGPPARRQAQSQRLGPLVLLQGSLACVPCGRAGCDNHRASRADCLPDITPQRVLAEAIGLLAPGPG